MRKSEIISLAALAAIGVGALAVGRYAASTAEERMIASAQRELQTIGFSELALEADGLVLAVSGRVRSRAEQVAVRERLESAPGVSRLYDNVVVVQPLVDLRPAILVVQKDDEALTLTGEAPNDEARDLLGARAEIANPGVAFLNLMKAQDRRPSEDWFKAAEASIDAVSALRIGRAVVERGHVRLEGAVSDADIKAAVERSLRASLAPDFTLEIDINAPPPLLSPYRFAARKTERGLEIIQCAAPDAAQRSVILGAARGATPERRRRSLSCQLANGAPNEDWVAAVVRAIGALAPLQEGEADIADDRVRITGFVEKTVNLENARLAALESWPELYKVTADIRETLPVVSPFTMTAVKRPGDASLRGHAPSLAQGERWALALDATNGLELARGAPLGWSQAADAAVAELASLKVGALTMTDRRLLLAAPGDASIRAQIRDRLRAALPADFRVEVAEARTPRALEEAVAAIAAPAGAEGERFAFSAKREPGGAVALSGVVGDVAMRAVVAAYAKAKLGGDAMSESLRLADDVAPAGWQRAVFAGLEALGELEHGELTAEPGAIYLRGETGAADAARIALATLEEKTPSEFARFSRIRIAEYGVAVAAGALAGDGPPLDPEPCVAELNRLSADDPIRFSSGSASIDRASDAVLDAMAAVLARCPAARIEIGGHTDSSGGESENQALSQRRASAVRLSLAVRGVARDRMEAVGYGESLPIADNDSEAGRAKNRRTEFKLL